MRSAQSIYHLEKIFLDSQNVLPYSVNTSKEIGMIKTKYTELVEQLWASDSASAMTNQAARAIEELVNEMIAVRAALEMMVDDVDDMNRIGAGIYEARIRKILQLKETE